jgi:hypothetical protein
LRRETQSDLGSRLNDRMGRRRIARVHRRQAAGLAVNFTDPDIRSGIVNIKPLRRRFYKFG